jgi:hypothetical protein
MAEQSHKVRCYCSQLWSQMASGQLYVSEITWFSHCGRLLTDRHMSNSLQEKRVHANPLVMISGWLNWLRHKTCIHSVPDKLRAEIQRPYLQICGKCRQLGNKRFWLIPTWSVVSVEKLLVAQWPRYSSHFVEHNVIVYTWLLYWSIPWPNWILSATILDIIKRFLLILHLHMHLSLPKFTLPFSFSN